MVRIFFCDTEKNGHFLTEAINFLTKERREKSEKIIDEDKKLLSVAAGFMLKYIVGAGNDKKIIYNEHGKPYLEHGPFFNISHSGKIVVLAVSKNEIGIDTEIRDEVNDRIIRRCFTDDEAEFSALSTENYLKVWTAKEAVLKLLGTGFSYSPKNFSVLPLDGEHVICNKKIKFYNTKICNQQVTAAYHGEEEFEIKEVFINEILGTEAKI